MIITEVAKSSNSIIFSFGIHRKFQLSPFTITQSIGGNQVSFTPCDDFETLATEIFQIGHECRYWRDSSMVIGWREIWGYPSM